jgi:hypothetical protein
MVIFHSYVSLPEGMLYNLLFSPPGFGAPVDGVVGAAFAPCPGPTSAVQAAPKDLTGQKTHGVSGF